MGFRVVGFQPPLGVVVDKLDLRTTEWREAICEIAEAVQGCALTNRALALLIADASHVTMTQALEVLETIPELADRYLKE
jgi:hypothetical protein